MGGFFRIGFVNNRCERCHRTCQKACGRSFAERNPILANSGVGHSVAKSPLAIFPLDIQNLETEGFGPPITLNFSKKLLFMSGFRESSLPALCLRWLIGCGVSGTPTRPPDVFPCRNNVLIGFAHDFCYLRERSCHRFFVQQLNEWQATPRANSLRTISG